MASTTNQLTDQPVNAWAKAREKEYLRMVSKQRKGRGMALGLALTAMLAFGALGAGAAQATPTWSIGGTAFYGTESFESKGSPVSFQLWGAKFECEQTGNGSMFGGDEGNAILAFKNCKDSSPSCDLQPLTTQKLRVDLVEVKGFVYERFAPAEGTSVGQISLTGPTCSMSGSWPLQGSFAAWFNVKQSLPSSKPALRYESSKSGDGLRIGTEAVILTGDSQQWLTGANAGYTWWWAP